MSIVIVHNAPNLHEGVNMRRKQEYLDYFKCERIVAWDGVSKLTNGDLAFTGQSRKSNNPQFGYPSANIYHVNKAKSLVTRTA